MDSLFFYGTLRHLPLLELILGGAPMPDLREAMLPGHEVLWRGRGLTITSLASATTCAR
jgi:hypothetical protein